MSLEDWTNVGGAIDMKIYNMDDSPLDLAVKNADHHNHDKMTQKFSHSTDNLTSLAPSGSALTSVIVENLDKVRYEKIIPFSYLYFKIDNTDYLILVWNSQDYINWQL